MPDLNNHIIIVGAGFSGLALAIQLKLAGIDDFTILERAGELGGTWRDNCYPGAACDVPSVVYSYSFAQSSLWTSLYSPQPEILEYLKSCADKYGLRPHIRFNTEVEAACYDEKSGLWKVQIADQRAIEARILIVATGGLSRPKMPDIAGLADFKGKLMHSAKWDHQFKCDSLRLAVIGTGASAIQIVPSLVDQVQSLTVFQRSPAWIVPKRDRRFGQIERFLLRKFPPYRSLLRFIIYWKFELRGIGLIKPAIGRLGAFLARRYLKKSIPDPDLRQKLSPNYSIGCKRVLVSNDFYPAMNRKHVRLETESIDRFTQTGIRTQNGVEHEFDVIVCATGFQVAEASAPFPILGKSGVSLAEKWQDGAEAYLGVTTHGFPNLFFIVGPNSGLGHNSIIFIIESQVRYILDGIIKFRRKKWKSLEVKSEVESSYQQVLARRFQGTVWVDGSCHSWYLTPSGKNTTLWPGFSFQMRLQTSRFRMADYHINLLGAVN